MVKVRDRNETRGKKYTGKFVDETLVENRRWTWKEKEQLLKGLYKHGHLDLDKLHKEIPTRSQSSIRSAISQYKKEARRLLYTNTKPAARKTSDEEVLKEMKSSMLQNTESWMEMLKSLLEDKSSIQYVLSKIFLIIAEVGDFPSPELCEDVDFREVYLCMHGIMNGYPCKEVSMKSAAYMFDCFNRMQVASNKLGHDRERKFLEETYGCVVPSTGYQNKSKMNSQFSNMNFTLLKRILEMPDANPLKVPMELLVKQRK